jgi:hypothetical protein
MLGAQTPSSEQRAQHAKKPKKPVTIVRASRSIAGEGARVPSVCQSRTRESGFFKLSRLNFHFPSYVILSSPPI